MKELAPIVLFVYNRPLHTQKTLAALKRNKLAKESTLYIYADGPKQNTSPRQHEQINEVRKIIQSVTGFKEITIVASEENLGLANSIVKGVNKIVERYKKIIVLEDDIVVGNAFLQYMNEALELYSEDENVGCVHAWNYYLNISGQKESTFFLKGADCWGWATWQRGWKLFNENGNDLLKEIREKKLDYEFNRRNTHNYTGMLEDQVSGKNDSWAIRWHASLFLRNKYCLHPVKMLVKNIGFDGTGTHGANEQVQQHIHNHIKLKRIPVEESEWFFKAYKQYQAQSIDTNSTLKKIKHLPTRFINKFKRIYNNQFKHTSGI